MAARVVVVAVDAGGDRRDLGSVEGGMRGEDCGP